MGCQCYIQQPPRLQGDNFINQDSTCSLGGTPPTLTTLSSITIAGVPITPKDIILAISSIFSILPWKLFSFAYYNLDEYKVKGFGWIDNVQKVSNKDSLYNRLNEKL